MNERVTPVDADWKGLFLHGRQVIVKRILKNFGQKLT
jgi:hypothetical protein